MQTSQSWIEKLGLERHPEGGYFREVYRADEKILHKHLPERYTGDRHHSTSIYFLLTGDEFSAFHRIKSDETWHFYTGWAITLHMIDEAGKYSTLRLGGNHDIGEAFQFTVKRGIWFAASVDEDDSYALVGCTVSPGFHFDDFELGKRDDLIKSFPQHGKVIRKYSRGND